VTPITPVHNAQSPG